MNKDMNLLELAREVFEIEATAIRALGDKLNDDFGKAIEAIMASSGRVIVCGMGKSGIIGKKIAATLASTGTPSFFMHPGEAYHGDLGMVTPEDVFIAISNSGATDELVKLLPFLKSNHNFLIAVTGNQDSVLAREADCFLDISVEQEACPLQLAPTASTTASLAMGDALAVTLMKVRGFQPENFARFHPGGSLGRRLLGKVEDEMTSKNLPFVKGADKFLDLIQVMTKGKQGLAIVQCPDHLGIITDGDIRRGVERFSDRIFEVSAKDLMSSNPISIPMGTRIEDALILMSEKAITSILVRNGDGIIVGIFKK